jgi:hypothetical protein
MNSKFLKICEKIKKQLNEANGETYNPLVGDSDNNPTQQDINSSEPAEEIKLSDKLESETQLVSNEQIVSILKSFKLFLQNEKVKNFLQKEEILKPEIFNKIIMLPDTISDKNALAITKELIQILDPTKKLEVNTKELPQEIPDSRF